MGALKMRRALSLLASVVFCAGCETGKVGGNRAENFPIVIGSSFGSDVTPCTDYGSTRNMWGRPYRLAVPSSGGYELITRHEGMDFCAGVGTAVYSASSGTIFSIVWENELRGGWVGVKTDFQAKRKEGGSAVPRRVYLFYLHIVPFKDLKLGDRIQAGDLIGHLELAGKHEIGPVEHLHFTAATCDHWWICHTDPNRFWQRGPGIVTCLDPSNPPPKDRIVAPIGC